MKTAGTLAACLLLNLAACAQGPAIEQMPVSAPLPEAAFEPPPVGTQTTWLGQDGSHETWTVVAVNADSYEVRSDRGDHAVLAGPFYAATSWTGEGGTGHAELTGNSRALFPLRVGNRTEWSRKGVHNGQAFSSLIRCTVADEARIAVPAGEFDT